MAARKPLRKPAKDDKPKAERAPMHIRIQRAQLRMIKMLREETEGARLMRDQAQESVEQTRKSWEKERDRANFLLHELAEARMITNKCQLLINNTEAITPDRLKDAFLSALREAGLAKKK